VKGIKIQKSSCFYICFSPATSSCLFCFQSKSIEPQDFCDGDDDGGSCSSGDKINTTTLTDNTAADLRD
ncbi:unnamed protein product, partial [Ceratitis capitata]